MDKNIVKEFFKDNKGKFSISKQKEVYRILLNTDQKTFNTIQDEGFDDPIIILLASVFVGYLGIGRFMMGDRTIGVLKLVSTIIIAILWYIIVVVNDNSNVVFYTANIVAATIILVYWFMDVLNVIKKSRQHNYDRLKNMIEKTNS